MSGRKRGGRVVVRRAEFAKPETRHGFQVRMGAPFALHNSTPRNVRLTITGDQLMCTEVLPDNDADIDAVDATQLDPLYYPATGPQTWPTALTALF